MGLKDLVVRQLKTEKSSAGEKSGKYVFLVKEAAGKNVLKKELEAYFQVKIVKMNTLKDPSAPRFLAKYRRLVKGPVGKKVVVTLAAGQTLPTVEVVAAKKEPRKAKP